MRRAPACRPTTRLSKKRSSSFAWLRRILLVGVVGVVVANHLPRVTGASTTTTHNFYNDEDEPKESSRQQQPRRRGDRFRNRFRPRQRRSSNRDHSADRAGGAGPSAPTPPPPWWKLSHNNDNNNQKQQQKKQRQRRFHANHQQQQQQPPLESFHAEALQSLVQWLFPMRRPRHLWEGVRLAVRSTITGIGLGLVSLVVLPLRGWRTQQWPGLCAGTLAGLLYATISSLGGVMHGTYQLVRGIVHTPQALWEQQQGKVWHATTEDWRYYDLQQEVEELNQARQHSRPVKDTAYYDLLQVSTDARPADIKRAYYTLAREVHPDKNRGSEQAAAQFRQLHTAYTTLYDDDQRAVYDQWGSRSSSGSENSATTGPTIPEFDVKVFFGVLFSSELVDSYIGTLSIASLTEQLLHFQRSGSSPQDLLQWLVAQPSRHHQTQRRQVEIAVTLQQRCATFVQGNVTAAAFRQEARSEARQIAATPLGPDYLRVLGQAWIVEAQQYLGPYSSSSTTTIPGWGLVQSVRLALQRQVQNWRGRARMVMEAVDLMRRVARHEKDEHGNIPNEALEGMLPEILDIVWAYNAHDIAQAVRGACFRLFHDRGSGHSRFAGLLRAEAIQILGEEFLAEGSVEEDEEQRQFMDYIARSEVAMQIAVMKASGQKDPMDAESMIMMHKRTPNERTSTKRTP